MAIDWQSTVARLDADPDVTTPAGTTVLSSLVSAGRAYEAAGQPDVLHESAQHRQWASLKPSQRLGVPEPPFYEGAYYTRLVPRSGSGSKLNKQPWSVEDLAVLPSSALAAYQYWMKRAEQLPAERVFATGQAKQIARYYIAKAEQAERDARSAKSPTYGQIEQTLVSAMNAAHAFLAA